MDAKIDELRQLVREQDERIRALETRLERAPKPHLPGAAPTRRQLFRLASAAAAGGLVAGVGGGVLSPTPAGAADGDNLVLGQENEASTATTLTGRLVVADDGSDAPGLNRASITGTAHTADGSDAPPVGVTGQSFFDGIPAGILPSEGAGVVGVSNNIGVRAGGKTGVLSEAGLMGLAAVADGVGVGAIGGAADLRLGGYPESRSRVDAIGHRLGELWVDDEGEVWLSTAAVAAGQTGDWQKVGGPATAGQLHMLSPSVRIYDSRAGEQPLDVTKGKLSNSAERVIDAKRGGAVPASANGGTPTAALVNVTITDTTSTGGFLALFENGTTWPGNSSINWDAVGRATANSTVVALDDQGQFKVRASAGGGTNFVIDVLGYWL